MIKTSSASNLLDANTSPAIGAEDYPQSLPPSTTEKRSHAEIGADGSPQSPPLPPTEKRNRLENIEQPPKSFPLSEHERLVCKGFDKLPPHVQQGYLKMKESFGPRWERFRMYDDSASTDTEPIGDYQSLYDEYKNNKWGDAEKFQPILNFKENPELYNRVRDLAEKAVTYFNDNNNQKLCFEDFERVASCRSCYHHYLLTIKAIDPLDANSVKVLRSKVLESRGVQSCELVPLDS